MSFYTSNHIKTCYYSGEFDDLLDNNFTRDPSHTMDEIELTYQSVGRSSLLDSNGGSVESRQNQKLLEIEELTLQTPTNGTTLVHNLIADIYDKDHLLVSTLLTVSGFNHLDW